MDHFAGPDVSVKDTSVCIVDDTGRVVREVKVASEPEALLAVLRNPAYHFKRIGLEAGPLSQWLFSAMAEADLPVICVETRHMRGGIEGTDQQDRPQRCPRHRPDDTGRALSSGPCEDLTQSEAADAVDPPPATASKAIAVDNDLRGTLRNFGLKVGVVGAAKFEARIRELVQRLPDLAVLVEPLLVVRRVLREQIAVLHRRLLAVVRQTLLGECADRPRRRPAEERNELSPHHEFHVRRASDGRK